MKKLFSLITILSIVLIFTSCENRTPKNESDSIMQKKTELAMQEANRQVGYPAITNFQEKKIMKMIYELRDKENYVCYAYLYDEMHGTVGQFLGKCLGYGLPYSTQFSNPDKLIDGETELNIIRDGNAIMTISQPEPNGLFMPEGLSATWLLMIDPKTNEPRPVYVEPQIIVSPFPLHNLK